MSWNNSADRRPLMLKPCAIAILLKDRLILLGKRSPDRKFYPNVWDLIGGHVEGNETPEQTLARELLEEIGVTPTQFRRIRILDELHANGAYQYHVYLVNAWIGFPRNMQPEEHTEIQWFTIADALKLDLALPAYRGLFMALDKTNK